MKKFNLVITMLPIVLLMLYNLNSQDISKNSTKKDLALSGLVSTEIINTDNIKISDASVTIDKHEEVNKSWSMVIIPDTQTYVRFSRNHGILSLMMAWIKENIEQFSIRHVLCVGDLVERNDSEVLSPKTGNINSISMWTTISDAFRTLDDVIPYILCTGNHDYGYINGENRNTRFNDFFSPGRNSLWGSTLVEYGPNSYGKYTLENAAFTQLTPSGQRIVFLSLQYAPTDSTLEWAKKLAARDEYSDSFIVLLTHSYLSWTGKRIKHEKIPISEQGGNPGESIWIKLIKPSRNIRLVICGHVATSNSFEKSVGYSVDINDYGKEVYQMLFNTQALGGGMNGNGGDGWLRILEFNHEMTQISVRTFSPLFNISPSTQYLAHETNSFNQFTITVSDPPLIEKWNTF